MEEKLEEEISMDELKELINKVVYESNAIEEISIDELRELINEALYESNTIEDVIRLKEEELKEIKEVYSTIKRYFKDTKEILRTIMLRLRFASILLKIEQGGAILYNARVDINEFDIIINDMNKNIKEIKEDLKFINKLRKAFNSLTKYNIEDKMEEITCLLTLYYEKTVLREGVITTKITVLSSRLKGINMISHNKEEKELNEKEEEIKKLKLNLGI